MTLKRTGLPRDFGYRMPAEWAPHTATWMSWPFDEDMWFGELQAVRTAYTALVTTLARFEPVQLIVRDAEARRTAAAALQGVSGVTLHEIPLDDVWMRDNGPLFVTSSRTEAPLSFVKWEFNSWGEKYLWQLDNEVPHVMGQLLNLPYFSVPVIMEGGSLDINGRGACLTTEQCLLSPKRNPHLDKSALENLLRDYLGIEQLVWLKLGLEGDHTDGHIDTITRFTDERTVVTSICQDSSDVNYERMQENLDVLRSVRLGGKDPLRIIELPLPERPLYLEDGTRLPPTYANFYIANQVVVVPQYDDPADASALAILKQVFRDREVIGLRSRAIIQGGGSFHCMTQQQPRAGV